MSSTLADCVTFINGDRGKNYPKQVDFANGEVPFVSASDLSNNSLSNASTYQKKITKSAYEKLRSGKVVKQDILLCLRGSLGKLGVVSDDMTAAIASSLVILRPHSQTNSKFLFQWLKSPDFQQTLASFDNGSVQGNLSVKSISKIAVPNFSPSDQKAIAHILGALDDKIELNQKMNQTLEEIAKAIFKSWFVDFDPVRAKAEGRPTGLPPEISDLFPDAFVDSEIGEIPKGWEVTNVGEITSKGTLKVRKFSEEVKVLSAVSSGQLRLSEDYFTKQVFSKNIDNYYVVPRFSFAYNPSRINIGSIGLNLFDFSGAVSPVYSVFTVREGMHWFFQEWLNLSSTKGLIASLCSGSVRQSLKHADMESILLVPPPTSVNTKFNEIYELFMESIRIRNQETQILSELRDTLLPKLISGELRIPDAEKFLEEAGI